MLNIFHDLNFIDQAFFSFHLGKQILFWKSFYCKFLQGFLIFNQINSCKWSFAYHFDSSEFFMKIWLDKYFTESILPVLEILIAFDDEITVLHVLNESNTALFFIILFIFFNILHSHPLSVHYSSYLLVCCRFKIVQVIMSKYKISVFLLLILPIDFHHFPFKDYFWFIYLNIFYVFWP